MTIAAFADYELVELGSTYLTSSVWGEVEVMALTTEVVEVMEDAFPLGIREIKWLHEDCDPIGCVLPFKLGTVFLRPSNILHPMDITSTTLHELAHMFVEQCGHHHRRGSEYHCQAWVEAVQFLTVLFGVRYGRFFSTDSIDRAICFLYSLINLNNLHTYIIKYVLHI